MKDSYAILIFALGFIAGIPVGAFLVKSLGSTVHNSEVWEYDDWQGKKRTIQVSRVVES